MNVILAKYAGACYGVNRSLKLVKEAINQSNDVATLGELIHNPQVVEELESKYGVRVINSIEKCETVIIRSHGSTIQNIRLAKTLCKNVIDATCPHVKAVQNAASGLAKKYGHVIIVGKPGHPEVESVCSYVYDLGANAYVVQNTQEANDLLINNSFEGQTLGLVSQTTMSQHSFKEILAIFAENDMSIKVINTICSATSKRQDSAEKLSKVVDRFIVIGGKNSSNTTHLAQICAKNCKTLHIEKYYEIPKSFLESCYTVGVSAGASTPLSQIEPVMHYLAQF